jgi:hypothetical protein
VILYHIVYFNSPGAHWLSGKANIPHVAAVVAIQKIRLIFGFDICDSGQRPLNVIESSLQESEKSRNVGVSVDERLNIVDIKQYKLSGESVNRFGNIFEGLT